MRALSFGFCRNGPVPAAEPTPFGKLVKKHRERRGWSQTRLATEAGLTPGYIGGIEAGHRGRRASRDVILAVAQALDLDDTSTRALLKAGGRPDDNAAGRKRPTFEQFVRSEPLLRAEQKEILIGLYRSWVKS